MGARIRFVLKSGKEFERAWPEPPDAAAEHVHLVFEALPDRSGGVEAFEVLSDNGRHFIIPSHSIDYVIVWAEDE